MTRSVYEIENGRKIVLVDTLTKEKSDVAFCDFPEQAIKHFDKGHYLNDVKRKYTASAREFFKAEQLQGFKWIEPEKSEAE